MAGAEDRSIGWRSRGAALVLVGMFAACGPGPGGGSTTEASSMDGDTTDGATSSPTSTTGAVMGCLGADAAACGASTPLNADHRCAWVDVFTAQIAGTLCRTALARSTCMEVTTNEGGPGCAGFFKKQEQEGVELMIGTGCGNPLSEPGWAVCFVDGVTPAAPECACIGEGYCGDQPDEATCMMATHDLRACAWMPGGCGPA